MNPVKVTTLKIKRRQSKSSKSPNKEPEKAFKLDASRIW